MSRLRKALIVAVASVSLVLVGSAAYAIVTNQAGTITDQQRFVHDTDPFITASGVFINVPTSGTSMTITSPHLFDARFTAEARCAGNVGWCSARIVLITPAGAVIELDPVVGLDFSFDVAPADLGEGHAIERTSALMPAGTYRFFVQVAVAGGAAQVWVDDWTFAVEAVRP